MLITYSLSINDEFEYLLQLILVICKTTCAMDAKFQALNLNVLLHLLLFATRLLCYNYSYHTPSSVLPSCCICLLHSCSTGV